LLPRAERGFGFGAPVTPEADRQNWNGKQAYSVRNRRLFPSLGSKRMLRPRSTLCAALGVKRPSEQTHKMGASSAPRAEPPA